MADDRMEDDAPEVEEVDLRNPDAVTKYKVSADIANKALSTLIKECVPGKKIADLCLLGDKIINDETKTKYTKGKIERGVAFPTCISVDNCVGHYSPLSTDETVLQEGNLVKIDLGAHIDGFICTVAHTVIATATPTVPVTGRKADVICAAHFAAETALRLMRPGKKNTEVTEAIEKVAQTFHCNPVEGVLSHQMKRFVIDGNKVIISKPTLDQKVEEFVFEENEVYAIDIVMSTGEGKPKETEARTTVYKRAVDQAYSLKMKAARYVFNEINAKFSTLPFAVRAFEDENRARLGIVECLRHALVHPYPVLFEKPGEFVAQFKFTVLLLPSSISKLTSHDLPFVKSEYSIADLQIKNILALGTKRKSKSKKAKKKKKVATAIEPASTTTTATATNTAPEAPSAMDTAT